MCTTEWCTCRVWGILWLIVMMSCDSISKIDGTFIIKRIKRKDGIAMARKPIIVYIEGDNAGIFDDDNPDRDALSYFLREYCGCEVIQYWHDYDFGEDLSRLKRYSDCRQIVLVIVKQMKYSEQHERVLQLVRGRLSANLPIVVIPDGWRDERFSGSPDDRLVYIFDHTDMGLVELVSRLVAEWEHHHDWLGAETEEDQIILMARLENAYRKYYLDDECERMFGTPDYNHIVVAEALRVKLLPVEFLKAEFDDAIEEAPRVFGLIQPSAYKKELEKIRNMSGEERMVFKNMLMRARGLEPMEGGGVFVRRVSCGDNINGFAIDPVTLEALITYRSGFHHMAGDRLARRIQAIEALRNHKSRFDLSDDEKRECNWRLITGLIFSKIDGFAIPMLQLYTGEADNKQISKVARFLKNQRKFIPVDHDGQLIEG